MVTLENNFLKVNIRSQGAEITSLINKSTVTEHVWQADADVWPWHAPNLFPVVGGCTNNEIHADGKTYRIGRHGFARNTEFAVADVKPTHAKFSLVFNENTLEVYPYKFTFQVLYDLVDNKLRISFKVINNDDKTIYFSVGAHPAFNVPFFKNEVLEDYYLEFEKEEVLETHLLSENGLFNGAKEIVPADNNRLPLTDDLFAKDALVLKDLKSRNISIKSKNHEHSLSVKYPHFNYLGLWSKPGASFVCIEPWLGCADSEGKTMDIKEKEAIHALEYGHVFEVDFTIELN
ncbi:MAG: aldose 1-epimerase family protein [Sphingobacteriales bacterium]|nr:aldose 1-epimerase family protein [Sphingobacteriales bacterium]